MALGQESGKPLIGGQGGETWVTPSGGTPADARTLAEWVSMLPISINVKDYGAVGDDTTDDTDAINDAIDDFKAAVYAPSGTVGFLKARLVFPPGVYKVGGSLNFQSIQRMGWTVDCTGAIIRGTGAGKSVIDLLGSRGGEFRNLTLVGDGTSTPAIGVQTGRFVGSTAADNMTYYRPVFDGEFTRSCVYNLAAEIDTYVAPVFRNIEPSGCAIIYDGCNHYGAITDYTAPTAPADTAMSCIQHTHLSGTYGCGNSDRAIEITSGSQFRFIDGTAYAKPAANGEACAILLNAIAGVSGFKDLYFDIHQELCSVYLLAKRSSSGAVTITGLDIRDIAPQATTAMIKADSSITTLTVSQGSIQKFGASTPNTSGPVTLFGARLEGAPAFPVRPSTKAIDDDKVQEMLNLAEVGSTVMAGVLSVATLGATRLSQFAVSLSGTNAISTMFLGSGVLNGGLVSGVPADGSGTDGNLTVYISDNDRIYVSNRLGGNQSVAVSFMPIIP